MIHAMQIITRFLRKRKERKLREAQGTIEGGKQTIHMDMDAPQNLSSFMNDEDKNTHRELRLEKSEVKKQKELTGFDRLAIEMDMAIENLK